MDKKWKDLIEKERNKPYFKNLLDFIENESKHKTIFPPKDLVFNAFELTPFEKVSVVIIGQDPYHELNQATGLAFSVNSNVKLPKSLINIYKELDDDLGVKNTSGDLSSWAKQGVFLLNTILTVEEGKALSHKNIGWETFTNEIIKKLNADNKPKVFLLWGNNAKKFTSLINNNKHMVITSAHPSPLSAHNGFWKSKPFSRINKFLLKNNLKIIDWKTY
jgi:uracil-DNA glycosylase